MMRHERERTDNIPAATRGVKGMALAACTESVVVFLVGGVFADEVIVPCKLAGVNEGESPLRVLRLRPDLGQDVPRNSIIMLPPPKTDNLQIGRGEVARVLWSGQVVVEGAGGGISTVSVDGDVSAASIFVLCESSRRQSVSSGVCLSGITGRAIMDWVLASTFWPGRRADRPPHV